MHLVIDAIGVKHSGGAVVLLDFLSAALEESRITRLTLFCSPRKVRNFDLPTSAKLYSEEQPLAEQSYAARIWWFQIGLSRACRRIGADLLFCMVGAGRGDMRMPHVTFIQQSLPFSTEVYRRSSPRNRVRMRMIKFLMHASCRSAQLVLVQTPTMQQWVTQAFHLPTAQCSAIWPTLPVPLDTTNCPPQTKIEHVPQGMRLLYVGSDAPHKNLALVVAAMPQLRNTLPEATLLLTLPEEHPFSQMPGVVCLGYLSGCDLWKAYAQSDVLVMPALVETVGLPMLEALRMGKPVLAADRPYAHDVCGKAALFFNPLSSQDFAYQTIRLLRERDLQQELIVNGCQVIKKLNHENLHHTMVDAVMSMASRK